MKNYWANGYSSESSQGELSNEYQHDRVWMIFKNLCILVLWMKIASALERLTFILTRRLAMSTDVDDSKAYPTHMIAIFDGKL